MLCGEYNHTAGYRSRRRLRSGWWKSGFFYTNIVLRGPSQRDVVAHLTELGRIAFVSPTIDNITVVYDRECEDQSEAVLEEVGAGLSRRFRCPALVSLVHDSDLYMYWLFDAGERLDVYNAIPDYFDDEQPSAPTGGNARQLCRAFGVEHAAAEVHELLHPEGDGEEEDWPFGEDLHAELAELLEFPPFAAGVGYYVIEGGELPDDVDRSTFVEIRPGSGQGREPLR